MFKKLFDVITYVVVVPVTIVVALFRSNEKDRGVTYDSNQAVTDAGGLVTGTKDLYAKIEQATRAV